MDPVSPPQMKGQKHYMFMTGLASSKGKYDFIISNQTTLMVPLKAAQASNCVRGDLIEEAEINYHFE